MHGYMDAAATWDLCAPTLVAAGYRVLAPDLRGYGSSDRVPVGGYYHFPDYVADVSRVLDEHVPGPVLLVGHSMGGTVATLYAGTRPERVQKLALLEGMGPPDNPPDTAPLRMKRWLDDLERHRAPKTQELFARPMTEEERKIFQALVSDGFTRFKEVVKSGRPKFKQDPAALDKLATGQVFTADQAEKNGLVDKIGFIDDAVDRAIELANLDKDNVKVVRYKPEPSLANVLFGVQSAKAKNFDLAAMLDLATPRAYYLCTWLPAAAAKP